MPVLRIPTPLRAYTNGESEVFVRGSTVAEAIQDFVAEYPAIRSQLFNGEGELRPFVNLFVNEEDIRHLGGFEAALHEEDRLVLIPSIAGG